jgi:hypothetical protein
MPVTDDCSLGDLLFFWTSRSSKVTEDLVVKLVETGGDFPESSACFCELKLPVHATYDNFRKNMSIALQFAARGFGNL